MIDYNYKIDKSKIDYDYEIDKTEYMLMYNNSSLFIKKLRYC